MRKKKAKYDRGYSRGQKLQAVGIVCILLAAVVFISCNAVKSSGVKETEGPTFGVDVARYQGTIDWAQVAGSETEFAMVRVGYRAMVDGEIKADSNAKYNMQEAQKNDIKLGVYFFSTAISEEEAVEEANWVADFISQYPITYPVAYDCEGYNDPESRQFSLTKAERTDIALAFLETIEDRGYEGMFYASKNELQEDAQWETGRISADYKIWVAQYPTECDPKTDTSSYREKHDMWQYSANGSISGIEQGVDLNVAYFGYDGIRAPQNEEPSEEAFPDVEALMYFEPVNESVTAKEETNLRNVPSQGEDSVPLYLLKNGEVATRIGISDSGWSKVEFNGNIYYAVSSLLTTDLDYYAIKTQFEEVNEQVTAKIEVNLRTLPSAEHEDSQIVVLLKNSEVVTRTGINKDVGWSRVEYKGQTLYCISSYLSVVE